MLPKIRRLNRVNFLKVLNSSKDQIRDAGFTARYLKNALDFNRYSVVVTKKISKLAVVRNGVKRKIYDAIKDLPGSYDIIIYPKDEKISSELYSLLSKLP